MGAKRRLNGAGKKRKKNQLKTLYEQKLSNLRPHLYITFPQGFQKSKK